jgi:hypothetical protein
MFQKATRYYAVSTDIDLDTGETQPKEIGVPKRSFWAKKKALGWRFTIINGAILSCIVFILNLTATIIAHNRGTIEDGPSYGKTLYQGDCKKVKNLGIIAHLFINLFSTILLSASNYAMQCLSAPTREEVDQAHAKSMWLDIGVLSIRNLRNINKKRSVLCMLLGLSSLPLHLL